MPDHVMLSRRRFTIAGLLAGAGLAATACGGGRPAGTASAGTLRLGQFWPPVSLDPAKAGGESALYLSPAYDPLIYRAPDGTLKPRLATSWRYLGDGNTAFEIELRHGVTFSDGTPLDAAAVTANIDHVRATPGQASAFLTAVSSVTAASEHTVRLTLTEPHPHLPEVFSQDYFVGNLVSPAALADPDRLAEATFGAGPYRLDAAQTVSGDHYTYLRNPRYWNVKGTNYDTVVIKVLPNENTALAALKTGQVDVIAGSYAIAGGAKAAGLRIASTPNVVMGLQLNDRAGTLSPPLRDVRVRQALNFAVDRTRITKALLGEYGVPTEQPSAPGIDGYREDTFYRYDPDHARRLLAEAGYAKGFPLPVVIPSTPAFPADIAQAVAANLEQVGVLLEISAKEPAAASTELTKYPASIMGWGVLPVYFMGRGLWLADAVGMNPFHSSDRTLADLDRQAAAADERNRTRLNEQIIRRVVELGWFLPVCLSPIFLFHRDTVVLGEQDGKPLPSLDFWRPAA